MMRTVVSVFVTVITTITTTEAFRIPVTTRRHYYQQQALLSRPITTTTTTTIASRHHQHHHYIVDKWSLLLSSSTTQEEEEENETTTTTTVSKQQQQQPRRSKQQQQPFDLNTALFCGGLAFDAYVEPPQNSSRWEKGSKGMNVAFVSSSFTKQLYQGMVEVTPIRVTGLPDEEDDNIAESMLTGGGVDASLLVAAVEGQWKEDLELLQQEYHEGIMDLTGAAHVGRSSTAWSNVNEKQSKNAKKKTGTALPYHVKKSWGKDASAVWPEGDDSEPFYLYVQDPARVQLLFTLFDDDVIGEGSALGSTYTALSKVLPQSSQSQQVLVDRLKQEIVTKLQKGEIVADAMDEEIQKAVMASVPVWEGELKLTSKPRIKNKNNQITMGVAAGAMIAGPAGAAVGALIGNFYEGQIKGRIQLRLRYLPIPSSSGNRKGTLYQAKGGMPGIDWGDLYNKYLLSSSSSNTNTNNEDQQQVEEEQEQESSKTSSSTTTSSSLINYGRDLEFCFVINHDVTGGCCAVYRDLDQKLIVVSFRGTCEAVDLLTDASIVQEPWVEGTEETKDKQNDENTKLVPKVHVGFRKSLNSISRRLKELVLATVQPGDKLEDYDLLVTGHSLGGALATLFVADIGEYGMDAGRALPQTQQSDDWWKALANTFSRKDNNNNNSKPDAPPRPKSLRLYNFGSPRVGNAEFSRLFDTLLEKGRVDQAYRLVNDQDVVARAPRTMVTLSVDYDHCGSTVLVGEVDNNSNYSKLWIEGESDDTACPVRDYENRFFSPTSEGTLLGDLLSIATTTTSADDDDNNNDESSSEKKKKSSSKNNTNNTFDLGNLASKVSQRLSKVSVSDVASVIGIDKNFSEREMKMIQSFVKGDALAHHLEDSYYAAMGRASGFRAIVGETVVVEEEEDSSTTTTTTTMG